MDLFDKVKDLLDKEHDKDISDNKVMLSVLWDYKTDDGVAFANGSKENVAFAIVSFLRRNDDIMKAMIELILGKDESKVLQQES